MGNPIPIRRRFEFPLLSGPPGSVGIAAPAEVEFTPEERRALLDLFDEIDRCQAYAQVTAKDYVIYR